MDIQLTENERTFLLQLLDQVNVSGVEAKTMIVLLMEKFNTGEPIEEETNGNT